VSRVIDRFLKLDMKLLAADGFCNDIARLAPIGIGATARTRFLRIAAIAFHKPRAGFQKLEVR